MPKFHGTGLGVLVGNKYYGNTPVEVSETTARKLRKLSIYGKALVEDIPEAPPAPPKRHYNRHKEEVYPTVEPLSAPNIQEEIELAEEEEWNKKTQLEKELEEEVRIKVAKEQVEREEKEKAKARHNHIKAGTAKNKAPR